MLVDIDIRKQTQILAFVARVVHHLAGKLHFVGVASKGLSHDVYNKFVLVHPAGNNHVVLVVVKPRLYSSLIDVDLKLAENVLQHVPRCKSLKKSAYFVPSL